MNKYLIPDKSLILKNKLEKLAQKLQGSLESGQLQTKEAYIFESIRILNEFYKDLTEPQLQPEDILNIRVDDLPDPELYSQLWNKILEDLTVIFLELENMELLTLANFNYITTESNRLTSRLKKVSSLLGDYILYSLNPNKDSIYFRDSFNDLSKILVNSGLINTRQCEINQIEGIVTLPIDKTVDPNIQIKEAPIINSNSNGVIGNNQQIGAAFNGNLSSLIDNNPDTWLEYEKITTKAGTQERLILDLTINLGQEQVVNFIRINPNNFGTKTVIKIDTIETSLDGQVYTSIKDDIPIADFVEEDEDNVFTLAPSTSKFAGQGLYTFTPRKVKYIHFVFQQNEPYTIQTPAGERLRYAIGIRDIHIENRAYFPEGEIVSREFTTIDEIRKVLLESNQNPAQLSELATIQWFISPDNGSTWHEIQPKQFDGLSGVESTPEVLEFNGPSIDSIDTAVPVYSLQVRALLKRFDEQFKEGSTSLNKRIINTTELHQIPLDSPFTIELTQPPVDKSIVVVDPLFGSRGLPDSQYILGHTDRLDTQKFRLPFRNLPRPNKKVELSANRWITTAVDASEWLHLEVGGEEWTQAPAPLLSFVPAGFSDLVDLPKYYHFDIARGTIELGNGFNTAKAADNAPVSIYFDAERLFPSADENHIARLDFSTSNNKTDMTIRRYDELEEATEILPRRATVIRLENQNIVDYTTLEAKINAMIGSGSRVEFLNGKDEITSPTEWSIDTEAGIVYLGSPTPDNSNVSINYQYQPIYILTEEDWDWETSSILRDSVTISDNIWKTIRIEEEPIDISTDMTVFDLSKMSIVKNTLSFILLDSGTPISLDSADYPFVKEVDFIDGRQELGLKLIKTIEQIPALATSGTYAEFSIKENIAEDTEADVVFSNASLFQTLVASFAAVNGTGKYFIDTNPASPTYGAVRVYTTINVASPGKITYFYTNALVSNNGLYSVDYKNGKIYLQRELDDSWTLAVTYEYIEFRAEYRIARLLDPRGYEVDITNQIITIKDSEILKFSTLPKGSMSSRAPFYLINYDYIGETREDIVDLRDSFTPIIKDYALRILPKGRIF